MFTGKETANFLINVVGIDRLISQFADIRKNPTIAMRDIVLSVFLMPFYSLTSLLSLDRMARKSSFKKLFGCNRKMVVSDTTVARVLSWMYPWDPIQLLLSCVEVAEKQGLLKTSLEPDSQPRRIGIIDGSVMAGHHQVTFSLHGCIDAPAMVVPMEKRGKELPTALAVLDDAHRHLGCVFPDLILCDSLYFNRNVFKSVRKKGAHILIKGANPEFRNVLRDAKFLFDHKDQLTIPVPQDSGFDSQRWCSWRTEKTNGEFAGFPIQILHLVENYPKRTSNPDTDAWIVTTDLSLSSSAIREAAHLRWHIENNVFKRLSHLSGTKRFYFKDRKRFFALLRIFLAALAVFDALIYSLRKSPKEFKALMNGMKMTWRNLFSVLQQQLESNSLI